METYCVAFVLINRSWKSEVKIEFAHKVWLFLGSRNFEAAS